MLETPDGSDGYRVHFVIRNAKPLTLTAAVDADDVEEFVRERYSMWEINLGQPDDDWVTEIVVAAENPEEAERKGAEYASDGDQVLNRPVPRGPPLVESIEEIQLTDTNQ